LLAALRIPLAMMPTVQASSSVFGQVRPELLGHAITIGGVAGDQQSALFGQACFGAGMAKNTYGTGCFMLMHTGQTAMHSQNGLITTSAAQVATQPKSAPQFALEGSVFVGGAVVQWLRDGLGAIRHSSEVQALAESVPDSGGVMVVPAFTGLGAPYWRPDARGSITGLTRGSTVAHIARAALESIAFQSAALLQAMGCDLAQAGVAPVHELRVDGGACVNNLLMQFQADLLGLDVVRPEVTETTALGAAYLAGLSTGVFANTDELSALWRAERRFTPQRLPDFAIEQMALWEHAVRKTVL
jgi:glycerol kinase